MTDLSKILKFLDDSYRESYLDSFVKSGIAYQIQALREEERLNQTQFGRLIGTPQSVVSRLESTEYGAVNVNTLIRIANRLKIGLEIRFCNFEAVLAADLGPNALKVDNIHKTVRRLRTPVVTAQIANTATTTVNALPIIGNSQAWQIQQVPSSPSALFPGSATLSFERYMPTSVLPEYHLST